MTFDEFKKEFGVDESPYSAEYYIIESAFKAGVVSRQAEIDDALKQRDSFIKAHHIAMNDVFNLKAERDALQEVVNREREQATEYYTDFHCAVAECDALQKRIDLIVDLVHDQTTDYFLDNLIQDILKGGC